MVGEARNGADAWSLIHDVWPTILVTDIMMPDTDGIWLIQQIEEQMLPIVTIVVSGHDDFEYARQAIFVETGFRG